MERHRDPGPAPWTGEPRCASSRAPADASAFSEAAKQRFARLPGRSGRPPCAFAAFAVRRGIATRFGGLRRTPAEDVQPGGLRGRSAAGPAASRVARPPLRPAASAATARTRGRSPRSLVRLAGVRMPGHGPPTLNPARDMAWTHWRRLRGNRCRPPCRGFRKRRSARDGGKSAGKEDARDRPPASSERPGVPSPARRDDV